MVYYHLELVEEGKIFFAKTVQNAYLSYGSQFLFHSNPKRALFQEMIFITPLKYLCGE